MQFVYFTKVYISLQKYGMESIWDKIFDHFHSTILSRPTVLISMLIGDLLVVLQHKAPSSVNVKQNEYIDLILRSLDIP